jgi:hypothetical protein
MPETSQKKFTHVNNVLCRSFRVRDSARGGSTGDREPREEKMNDMSGHPSMPAARPIEGEHLVALARLREREFHDATGTRSPEM